MVAQIGAAETPGTHTEAVERDMAGMVAMENEGKNTGRGQRLYRIWHMEELCRA